MNGSAVHQRQAARGLRPDHPGLGRAARPGLCPEARAQGQGRGDRARRDVALSEKKPNKLWVWKAWDRATGRLVDWECGGRDRAALERLLACLKRWSARLYCADGWAAYAELIPLGRLYAGKEQAHGIERRRNRASQCRCARTALRPSSRQGWLGSSRARACRSAGRTAPASRARRPRRPVSWSRRFPRRNRSYGSGTPGGFAPPGFFRVRSSFQRRKPSISEDFSIISGRTASSARAARAALRASSRVVPGVHRPFDKEKAPDFRGLDLASPTGIEPVFQP